VTRALGSLTNRIFLASTLLATVSIGAGVYFVSNRLRAEAEIELARDLSEAAAFVEQQRAALLESFMLTARLIATSRRSKLPWAPAMLRRCSPLPTSIDVRPGRTYSW
jgi:hypothetical protein